MAKNKEDKHSGSFAGQEPLLSKLERYSAHHNTLCSCSSEKRMSQWEELMRKFSRAHQEKCRLRPATLNIPRTYRSTKYFPTGSQYAGTWDMLGMSGRGVYTFPNGVVYEGEFEDGMFHGRGMLQYEDGTTLRGVFHKGVMVERKLTFADGLEYEEEDWQYCKMPDRRYTIEYEKGLQPAGKSNITAKMPPREIPPGFYDTGDGFYNPLTKSVYRADDLTAVIRSPGPIEQKWIVENCRISPDPIIGPRQHLYEKWSEPHEQLPEMPPSAAAIQTNVACKKPSIYDDDEFTGKTFYDPDNLKAELSKPRPERKCESMNPARRSSDKRMSSSTPWNYTKKCEQIDSCTPSQFRTKVRKSNPNIHGTKNEGDDETSVQIDLDHRTSLYNYFPSSIMMFLADDTDEIPFDEKSVCLDSEVVVKRN